MPLPTVYLETTVIGHLVGRIHPDPVIASRQRVTREWWATAANRFQLFASKLVVEECSAGNRASASERLAVLEEVNLIVATADADALARQLIAGNALPSTELRDAVHISLAAVFGIQYLLTWNFKHIANPATRWSIESICRDAGYTPPIIGSPDDFIGVENDT